MKPSRSYIIWFSQRTGSTLLSRALEDTGIAGHPREWLPYAEPYDLTRAFGASDPAELQGKVWEAGLTPNGVFGMKVSFSESHNTKITEQLLRFPGCPQRDVVRLAVWAHAFPNCKHVFMTRRNKVRLAVSWWKAIKSGEWHRVAGTESGPVPRPDDYDFDALRHLLLEAVMREAGIQELLGAGGVVPLTVVYEDLVADFEATLTRVLDFLEIPDGRRIVPVTRHYVQLADRLSEQWVERFRLELQTGWPNKGWD